MNVILLHRFTTEPSFFLDACLVAGESNELGIFYKYIPSGAPQHTYLTSLTILNIQEHIPLSSVIFNEHGPQNEPLADALIRYDSAQKRWIIAERLSWEYILLRTITVDNKNGLILSPACLFDRDQFSDKGFPPLLDLECMDQSYRLLYHKPSEEEHRTAAIVTKLDFVCQPGWSTLKERVSTVQFQNVDSLSWQQWLELSQHRQALSTNYHLLDKVLLPEQVLVDPGTENASQTVELELVSSVEVAEAENAMTIVDQQTRLLMLCSPETWVAPNEHPRTAIEIEQTGEQWHIWLTGWERTELTYKWTYMANIGLPADPNIPSHEIPRSPTVELAVIAGPTTADNQPTFVATIAMQGAENLLSHGVCLTHDGQVVRVCNDVLGRYPSLCLCRHSVIGVDRLANNWRLWHWHVLDEATLDASLLLDDNCQRAIVRTQPGADRFWLVEELSDGVRVSLHDGHTLREVNPATLIAGVKLPEGQADRPLEPQRNVGLIPYHETLLLLLLGKEEELLLYQVQ